MSIEILSPGLVTTVQDAGRWGYQSFGVPVAGPMDAFSHRLANALVGNHPQAASLEVTLAGPALAFHSRTFFAVAGAEFDLLLDNSRAPCGMRIEARAGAVLRFAERRRGARAYLAIAGGIDVPLVLGSRATHLPTKTGGMEGRRLKKGDILPLFSPRAGARAMLADRDTIGNVLNEKARSSRDPFGSSLGVVRVLPGPQAEYFAEGTLESLVVGSYRITPDSDRMAFRLDGPAVPPIQGRELISDATPFGAVQVPPSGQPILLMADRPTTGGYPKLAVVISADIGIAAQIAPGDQLQFRVCDHAEALAALLSREQLLLSVESRLS